MEMTMNLVKKNFIHLFYSLRSVLWTTILLGTCLSIANFTFALVLPALTTYLTFYSMMAYEERSKGYLFTSALPVTREDLCRAQYIEVFIYMIGSVICATIGLLIKQAASGTAVQIGAFIAMMLVIALIYNSIILPCVFYFGTAKARYFLMGTYMVVFAMATGFNIIESDTFTLGISKVLTGISGGLIFIIAFAMWMSSYAISLNIFKHKDFK